MPKRIQVEEDKLVLMKKLRFIERKIGALLDEYDKENSISRMNSQKDKTPKNEEVDYSDADEY